MIVRALSAAQFPQPALAAFTGKAADVAAPNLTKHGSPLARGGFRETDGSEPIIEEALISLATHSAMACCSA